jgi:hypothetical protein
MYKFTITNHSKEYFLSKMKNQQKQSPERMKNPIQSDDNTSLGHLDKGR